MVAELGAELGPAGLAAEAAPHLVPYPCDEALAREHVMESADPVRRRDLDAIPGALDVLASGVADSVASGLAGLTRDLELQVEPPDVVWDDVAAPVDLWYGERDTTSPPAFGRWWAETLRWAELTVVPGAGHLVALSHWEPILTRLLDPNPFGSEGDGDGFGGAVGVGEGEEPAGDAGGVGQGQGPAGDPHVAGAPDGARTTSMSCQSAAPRPTPSALSTASLAAKRAAKRSAGSGPRWRRPVPRR